MKKIDFDKIDVEIINLNQNDEQVREVYEKSFPEYEKVDFEDLYAGVFEKFILYGFFYEKDLIGFVHVFNGDDFVHLNYLAVNELNRSVGVGSYILTWIKNKHNNKPLVADVENLDSTSPNNEQRFRRLKFYYKNGFIDGKTEFEWEGTSMYYIHTNTLADEKFMKHIRICFPTIKNLKPHTSNFEAVKNYEQKNKRDN